MKASTQLSYRQQIDRALAWLEDHPHDEVSATDLARVAHCSAFHFHRVFRGLTGESVMACVRRLRLEAAARRLRHGGDPVIEIALSSGFTSHEGFTRAFGAHFGRSPTAYRSEPDPRIERARAAPPLAIDDVEVRTCPERTLVCMGHRGSFEDAPGVWERFITEASALGLFSGREQLVGRYPDDPDITPVGHVRFDVCVENEGATPLPAPFFRRTVRAGRWAVALHRGSYATLSETYLRLVGGWFPRTNTPLANGPCLEFYLNLPHEVPQEELRTEVWAPIETRS